MSVQHIPNDKKQVTTRQAIDYTGIPSSTFRSLVRNRQIPVVAINSRVHLFKVSDLDLYLEKCRLPAI
jgi:excisionase family DNA binding protein